MIMIIYIYSSLISFLIISELTGSKGYAISSIITKNLTYILSINSVPISFIVTYLIGIFSFLSHSP